MVLYRSKITDKLMTEYRAKSVSDVFGEGTFANALTIGILEPIENPSVIDCLKCGSEIAATLRYREIHPDVTVKEAREMVKKIKSDMKKPSHKKKHKKEDVEKTTDAEN